jgi:hypothetical protein
MRDIDLVIGVSSIGAVAEWLDQPEDQHFGVTRQIRGG